VEGVSSFLEVQVVGFGPALEVQVEGVGPFLKDAGTLESSEIKLGVALSLANRPHQSGFRRVRKSALHICCSYKL